MKVGDICPICGMHKDAPNDERLAWRVVYVNEREWKCSGGIVHNESEIDDRLAAELDRVKAN